MCFLLRRYEHACHEASAQRNVKFTGTFTLRISPKTTSCRRIVKDVGMDSRALVGKTLPLLLWCSFIYKINYRLFSSFVRNEFFFNDGSFLSRKEIGFIIQNRAVTIFHGSICKQDFALRNVVPLVSFLPVLRTRLDRAWPLFPWEDSGSLWPFKYVTQKSAATSSAYWRHMQSYSMLKIWNLEMFY